MQRMKYKRPISKEGLNFNAVTYDDYQLQILSKININGTSYILPKTQKEKENFAVGVS